MQKPVVNYRSLPLATFILVSLVGCGTSKEPRVGPERPPEALSVISTEVEESSQADNLALSGTLRSRRETTLTSKLSGRITYLRVEEGDRVGAGERLVEIDTRDILAQTRQAQNATAVAVASQSQSLQAESGARARIAQAQAQLKAAQGRVKEMQARRDLAAKEQNRMTFLANQGAVPRQRADQAQTDYRVAVDQTQQAQATVEEVKSALARTQAGLEEARAASERSRAQIEEARSVQELSAVNLDYGSLSSPFAGIVLKKTAFEGEVASPGKPILQIQDLRHLELWLDVPESQAERIQLHQAMVVEIPALHKEYPASVGQIVASANPATRTFQARLRLANPGLVLMPGMFGRVQLPLEKRTQLLIPVTSVVQRGGLEGVFVVGAKAEFHLIKKGESQGDKIEVLSGLRPHDRVIVSPPSELQEGSPVTGSRS